MPTGLIAAYNLGKLGVNVDKSPVHLEDGELLSAQNAIRDPLGLEGGIRKRPGLVQFNGSAAAGSVLGGIGVPISLPAQIINGVTLGTGNRTIYWGRMTTASGLGTHAGWWKSIDKFATTASTISSSSPADPRAAQSTPMDTNPISLMNGMPGAACVISNRMYYAANNYTSGTDRPAIRVWDGVDDKEFCRIPSVVYSGHSTVYINSILAANGVIYVACETATDSATSIGGFVFSVDPSTAAVTPLGAEFTGTYIPYSLCWHASRLWVGTIYRTGTGNPGKIYYIRPDLDSAWTLDRTMANGRAVGFLYSFQGRLFAGAAGASTIDVEVRDTLGAWTSSLSVASGAASYFLNAILFKNNLYVAHWVTSGSLLTIRKYTGSAWSTPYTNSGGTNAAPVNMLFVDDGTLFAGGGGDNIAAILLTSTDGASYTDRTSKLTSHMGVPAIGTLVF